MDDIHEVMEVIERAAIPQEDEELVEEERVPRMVFNYGRQTGRAYAVEQAMQFAHTYGGYDMAGIGRREETASEMEARRRQEEVRRAQAQAQALPNPYRHDEAMVGEAPPEVVAMNDAVLETARRDMDEEVVRPATARGRAREYFDGTIENPQVVTIENPQAATIDWGRMAEMGTGTDMGAPFVANRNISIQGKDRIITLGDSEKIVLAYMDVNIQREIIGGKGRIEMDKEKLIQLLRARAADPIDLEYLLGSGEAFYIWKSAVRITAVKMCNALDNLDTGEDNVITIRSKPIPSTNEEPEEVPPPLGGRFYPDREDILREAVADLTRQAPTPYPNFLNDIQGIAHIPWTRERMIQVYADMNGPYDQPLTYEGADDLFNTCRDMTEEEFRTTVAEVNNMQNNRNIQTIPREREMNNETDIAGLEEAQGAFTRYVRGLQERINNDNEGDE